MAVFDPEMRRIVLRVVYDGPGCAGKTTNLEALSGFFTRQRRGELWIPETVNGRTQFFDWLDLDGGLVQGHPLRCQLVTVPGQRMLRGRRARLLEDADVVVFVAESTALGVQQAYRMLDVMGARRGPEAWPVPMIVQANKQDLPGALGEAEVRDRLGLEPTVPIVPARATEGAGVRETLVLAIRAAADRVQSMLVGRGVGTLEGPAARPEDVLEELRGISGADGVRRLDLVVPRPALPRSSTPPTSTPPSSSAPPPSSSAAAGVAPSSAPPSPPPTGGRSSGGRGALSAPGWPDPEADIGLIWPAVSGRVLVRQLLERGRPILRHDLCGQHGRAEGSGAHDLWLYELDGLCLKTSARRRFDAIDDARRALLRLARQKSALGEWLVPGTVLCVARDEGARAWLWTVTPWVSTLRGRMEEAAAREDEEALGEALADFADAAVDALLLALRSRLVLDVHPSNFAVVDGRVRYLDDDIAEGAHPIALGHAIARRAREYAAHERAIERYLGQLRAASERAHASAPEALERLRASLHDLPGRTPEMLRVSGRIRDALGAPR